MKVIFKKKARQAILSAVLYIEEQGFPINADSFYIRLLDFGESLSFYPDKYPLCRFPILAERMLRCAVFEKIYIFVYKVIAGELVIYDVIHARRMNF